MWAAINSMWVAEVLVLILLLVTVQRAAGAVALRLQQKRWAPPPLPTFTQAEIDAAKEELVPETKRRKREPFVEWTNPGWTVDGSGHFRRRYPGEAEAVGEFPSLLGVVGDGAPARRASPEKLARLIVIMAQCRIELFDSAWMKALATDGERLIFYVHAPWWNQKPMIEFICREIVREGSNGEEIPISLATGSPENAPPNYLFSLPESPRKRVPPRTKDGRFCRKDDWLPH